MSEWQHMLICGTPTPFSPIEEMRSFIADNERDPHPQMQDEVKRVRRYLVKAQQHHNQGDAMLKPISPLSVDGWRISGRR